MKTQLGSGDFARTRRRDIANLRLGFVSGRWELAAFVNNLFDEQARLALDQERGTRARVGFLVNQPRTFGVSARINFR
jgi:iron complex outermembrane recepter protein